MLEPNRKTMDTGENEEMIDPFSEFITAKTPESRRKAYAKCIDQIRDTSKPKKIDRRFEERRKTDRRHKRGE